MPTPPRTLCLYQIASEYLAVLDALADQEDLPEEAIHDTLSAFAGEFTDKAAQVAAYIRTLDAEATAVADVRQTLDARHAALVRHALRLRRYLQGEMERTGLTRVQEPWITVRLQVNPPRVVVDDEERIPACFKETVTTVKLLKVDLAQTLKSGRTVDGARLEQTARLVIR